jgi:hypothetical protein
MTMLGNETILGIFTVPYRTFQKTGNCLDFLSLKLCQQVQAVAGASSGAENFRKSEPEPKQIVSAPQQ